MSDERYTPELGQAFFGNAWGEYPAGDLGEACLHHVLNEIERVYWNRNQKSWDCYADPAIPGITFRPYHWGEHWDGGCGCKSDDPNCEANKPNLTSVSDIEIRWYKHPGRGTTTNRKVTPEEWRDWLNKTMDVLREYNKRETS